MNKLLKNTDLTDLQRAFVLKYAKPPRITFRSIARMVVILSFSMVGTACYAISAFRPQVAAPFVHSLGTFALIGELSLNAFGILVFLFVSFFSVVAAMSVDDVGNPWPLAISGMGLFEEPGIIAGIRGLLIRGLDISFVIAIVCDGHPWLASILACQLIVVNLSFRAMRAASLSVIKSITKLPPHNWDGKDEKRTKSIAGPVAPHVGS